MEELRIVSPVVLAVATAISTVTVNGNSEELKEDCQSSKFRLLSNSAYGMRFRSAAADGVAGFEQFYNLAGGKK